MKQEISIIKHRLSNKGKDVFFVLLDKEKTLDAFLGININHKDKETILYFDAKNKLCALKIDNELFGEIPTFPVENKGTATKKHEQTENNDMQIYFTTNKIKRGNRGDYYIEHNDTRFFLNYFDLNDVDTNKKYDIQFTLIIKNIHGADKEVIGELIIDNYPIPSKGGGGGNGNNTPATAPYNFIPLNEKIVPSEWKTQDKIPTFDKWQEGLYNGYIDYQIENLTDMFIGNETNDSNKDIKNIFALDKEGNKPMVSGSSFRGLIKNIMAICAHSKLSQVEDKKLFYRNLSDLSNFITTSTTAKISDQILLSKINNNINNKCNNIKNEIKEKIKSKVNSAIGSTLLVDYDKIYAGYLFKENEDYKIKPCNTTNGVQFFRINAKPVIHDNKILHFSFSNLGNIKEFETKDIYFEPTHLTENLHFNNFIDRNIRIKKVIPYLIKYALVTNANTTSFSSRAIRGKLVVSGGLGTNKHLHYILNIPDTNQANYISIDKNIVEVLKDDDNINIDEKFKILNRINNEDVPIFYIKDDSGKVKMIGHTAIFRQQYEKTIHNHINQEKTDNLDITEALFGMIRKGNTASIFTSRLNFIDAKLIEDKGKNTLIEPKIHGTPKPTAYRMYLKQNNGNPQNWNSENAVRGFKLYHHNNVNVKEEPGKWKEKSHPKKMASLEANCKFKGRIYFDNLSEIELGALLFVLKLKEGLALKIGASKAYGMGSIKISDIELYTINRHKRYLSLFTTTNDKQEFNLAIEKVKDYSSFISSFEEYILGEIKVSKKPLWETDRLKELEKILTFSNIDKQNWNEKTSYMKVDDKKWKNNLQLITELTSNI